MVEAASAPHPLSETELLDYLCVFKPETVAVTEVLYEAISSADFTLSEVTETALGDPYSGARNVVAKAAARLGLFMEVEVERPKHVMGQFPKYYTITEKAVHFAEAHNRLHLRLIRQEAFGSVPAADIVRLSRNAFQYTMGLPVRPVLQVNTPTGNPLVLLV